MGQFRLMCVLAHPDDESMGTGGILAKYAAEGVETYLVCATRGERGWQGSPEENPGPTALGKIREGELLAAAKVLGLKEVCFLDYIDGDLDRAEPAQVIGKIVGHLRRVRPQVVVSFGPDGSYGHPDHIAISQFTTAATVAAADAAYRDTDRDTDGLPTHRVSKLYYIAENRHQIQLYTNMLGDMVMLVDNVSRGVVVWQEWAITTRVDTGVYWRIVTDAIYCHRSQIAAFPLEKMTDDWHREVWSFQTFYRAFSLVNGGRTVERDLFEGLR